MSDKASVALTPEQLQALITAAVSTAVSEGRKPLPPSEEELAAKEQSLRMRKDRAELELATQAGRKQTQKFCSHFHKNRSPAVANAGDFLICVHCQAKIKPVKGPYDEPEQGFIVDENLYYTLRQAMEEASTSM